MKVSRSFIEAMRNATQLVRTRGPIAATRFIQGLLRPHRATEKSASVDAESIVEIHDPLPTPDLREHPDSATLPGAAGQFLEQRFSGPAGSRHYKVYVPSGHTDTSRPLIVMLHGCTQNPDDFATGTRANRWAESKDCLVAYPEQIQRANSHRCWNWFRPANQQASRGEPAIIAGIVKQVIDEYQIDTRRVYVAGLSAGGAMAAIMAREYPELFAAVGIHSGLPAGAAHDVTSAFAVLKSGLTNFASAAATALEARRAVPLIVLHGDADHTVNPANGDRLVQNAVETHQLLSPDSALLMSEHSVDAIDGSHAYRRTRYSAPSGVSVIEHWVIRGAGHAWSGGDAAGSYADARGPDATAAMLDFFAQHAALADAAAPVMDSTAPA